MNQSPENARAARIQKYKEERRKQLTAKTATLFSNNVTDRRKKKPLRTQSEDVEATANSSNPVASVPSTALPIRTTRTSRLRAAAATNNAETVTARNVRSSSTTSLLENKTKATERVKNQATYKRQKYSDKENLKSASTSALPKENGATKKHIHSIINKVSLEKDKVKVATRCDESKNVGDTNGVSNLSEKNDGKVETNAEKKASSDNSNNVTLGIELEKSMELNENLDIPKRLALNREEKEENRLNIELVSNGDKIPTNDNKPSLADISHKPETNHVEKLEKPFLIKFEEADVRKETGLLVPIRVREAKSFSELLSNLCSASQADLLFEDILSDKGADNVCRAETSKALPCSKVLPAGASSSGHSSPTTVPPKAPVVRTNEAHENKIDDEAFLLLGDSELKKLIPQIGPRIKIKNYISNFKQQQQQKANVHPSISELQDPVETLSSTPCESDIVFEYDNPLMPTIQEEADYSTHTVQYIIEPASGIVPDRDINERTEIRTKTRTPNSSPRPKTECSLPSSKSSPRNTKLHKPNKLSPPASFPRIRERRRSTDSGKQSYIPLSTRSAEKLRTSPSPVKQALTKQEQKSTETETTKERKTKRIEKSVSDSETTRHNRKSRAQLNSQIVSDKYHNSKRLTSLENSDAKPTKRRSPKHSSELDNIKNTTEQETMSTLHEISPQAVTSRLSQEMDSLAALTKQTLDRVNKLSNNLASNKLNVDKTEVRHNALFNSNLNKENLMTKRNLQNRGVTERLRDIDSAAQRLIDFEKQSAMFSDLSNDESSHSRRSESSSSPFSNTPVSILKRKSLHEENTATNSPHHGIASPPVTFSPSVMESHNDSAGNRLRQGILKKRRSLDESQVARRRSCSPEVSFADDGTQDTNKPILKNRRSSLEDVLRNRSPDGHIHGILKRKVSKEEEYFTDVSHGSPEPHGILKRKSNSSSSSSTTSSHVSIAQAVLLAAAGGAELVDDDKDAVRPILKKKSSSEERPSADLSLADVPKPILKKKSLEMEEYDFELPKRPILKSARKCSGDDGHTSSFDLSEDERGSRRPSLLRSRTSDHSGSECETSVRPILKQRGSSLTRERSQSPRPRLSFCGDGVTVDVTNFSSERNDSPAAGSSRLPDEGNSSGSHYPSAVIRRRNQRPKNDPRSRSLACDFNNELLSILNNRRLKVDECSGNGHCGVWDRRNLASEVGDATQEAFPSVASRIKNMEKVVNNGCEPKDSPSASKLRSRDRDRYKTQPITIEEMRYITSLEPGQQTFQAYSSIGNSFPSGFAEVGAPSYRSHSTDGENLFGLNKPFQPLKSTPYFTNSDTHGFFDDAKRPDAYGEANFLDYDNDDLNFNRTHLTLDDIEKEVEKVRIALDEDSRALDDEEKNQQEADTWSLNVSCDSGVYNRASSRDSGPHSGEELGLIECQEIKENTETNSSCHGWSSSSLERGLSAMERQGTSMDGEDHRSPDASDDEGSGFALGLVKSNSVIARASMWQQLQQQAKGAPKPLLRHKSRGREAAPLADRFKTQTIAFNPEQTVQDENYGLAQSKSTANVLDRDEDAKLDEDDPAKLSLVEKMKMFNSKLIHKPPMAGLPKSKEDRATRSSRLKTMPVLASQVQEAMEANERLTQSLTNEEVPRDLDFQRKMELFRSASAKNTSLEYLMRQNAKYRSLDLDDEPSSDRNRTLTPDRKIIRPGVTNLAPRPQPLAKGESSEGLKDEGIDSSSDESTSSVSSSDRSTSDISHSSDEIPGPKRRFHNRKNKLKSSRTDSDLTRPQKVQNLFLRQTKAPGTQEIKERLVTPQLPLPGAQKINERVTQAKNPHVKIPMLAKLRRSSEDSKEDDDPSPKKKMVKKLVEPIQLGKLRRPTDKVVPKVEDKPPLLKISVLNQEAKNKFFGLDTKDKSIDELTAAVRRYIPPVTKSMSVHTMDVPGSGSDDGESSGGREVRRINTPSRNRANNNGVQRSATHAVMPHRGGTIAERLAALQAAGANDWRARVCRLSPEGEDTKAIERAKNKINESLNAVVDEKKKIQIEDNELGSNILADRRNRLETAAQGWRKRVPQTDANLFTVAGRLERDKVCPGTPPLTPPAVPLPASPAPPLPHKFRSRKQPASPTNGFVSGPLKSASCAVVTQSSLDKPKIEAKKIDREAFKRSHSVSENISRTDDKDKETPNGETLGATVRVPRADDETFQAFFTPALDQTPRTAEPLDVDLDAIGNHDRQLLASDWARRAKRERKHAASRNPLKALAARTDILEEYSPTPCTIRDQYIKEKATANCGLAAEALAALASKEDFSNVALKSAAAQNGPAPGTKTRMLLQVKGRRRVQTRLVEPVHTNVNRGDCFILVTPDNLFLYIGKYANVIERNRSTDIALHIQNTKDLGCKNSPSLYTIDEQNKIYSHRHWNQFWSLLGVKTPAEYNPIETGHPDEDEIFESCILQTNMCYEVLDDELIPIKEYWGQVPKISMLHQSKTIVFDFGAEMYIWYGKNVALETRRRAAQLAQELFDDGFNYSECHINPINVASLQGARDEYPTLEKSAKTRPEWAILSKVTQHMETILFKEKFLDWPDYSRVIKVKPQENKANGIEITPCDAEIMYNSKYEEPDLVLEGTHVGRGTSYYDKESMRHFEILTRSVSKWIVRENDFQKVEKESELGEFYSGDSYIIRWEYQVNATGRELNGKPSKHNVTGRDRCAYFCWQGRDASSNEKGTAALLTVELDKEKGPQVRVAQGCEPPAFFNLFQGNLLILQGKRDTDKSRFKLFVTRGNVSNEAYLQQVPCSVRQLRSRGSLLLADTEKGLIYIWHGSRSLKHTKNVAIELANKLKARGCSLLFGANACVKVSEVKEGEEPKEFLEALGGNKQFYNSVLNSGKDSAVDMTPRLFHFTDLSGQFEANEILSPLRHEHLVTPFPFEQRELYSASQPALFLLDDGKNVWLWQGWWPRGEDGELEPAERNTGVGAFAGRWQACRVAALQTCERYWRASRTDLQRTDVQVIAAGLEPQAFTELFDEWTEHDDAADANIAHGYKSGEILSGACELSRLTSQDAILPLAALQRRPLPEHVNPQHLERHLASPDFMEAFGMSKDDFTALPAWKQTNLKKDVGLF